MKVKELIEKLNMLSDFGHGEDVVRVPLAEPSVGAKSGTNITCVSSGFDWDSGTVFINTEESLARTGRTTDSILKMNKTITHTNRVIYHCPRCGEKVRKTDYYCSCCGQRIGE